jgi:hypothetical protein
MSSILRQPWVLIREYWQCRFFLADDLLQFLILNGILVTGSALVPGDLVFMGNYVMWVISLEKGLGRRCVVCTDVWRLGMGFSKIYE